MEGGGLCSVQCSPMQRAHMCDPTNVSSVRHDLGPSKLSSRNALHPQGPHNS